METNAIANSLQGDANERSSLSIDLSELVGLKPKVAMQNTRCPHKDSKHYAKGMCSLCYRKRGREAQAHSCPHKNRLLYSKGMCQCCYLASYHKTRLEKPAAIFIITKVIRKRPE